MPAISWRPRRSWHWPERWCRGDHIRVTLVISRFTGTRRRAFEIFCLIMAVAITGAFACYSIKMAWWSYKFNDISTANDATPLWIPQIAMALGTAIFCIAYVQELVLVLRGKLVIARQMGLSE